MERSSREINRNQKNTINKERQIESSVEFSREGYFAGWKGGRGDARHTSLAHANLGSRRCTADGPNEGCIPSRLFARWQICQWTLGGAAAWKDPPSIRRLPLRDPSIILPRVPDTLHRTQGNAKARARISRERRRWSIDFV